ncbi:hypothetical protein Tco_0568810 [Tanacetum coccineum]
MQDLIFLEALIVCAANATTSYDSDDEVALDGNDNLWYETKDASFFCSRKQVNIWRFWEIDLCNVFKMQLRGELLSLANGLAYTLSVRLAIFYVYYRVDMIIFVSLLKLLQSVRNYGDALACYHRGDSEIVAAVWKGEYHGLVLLSRSVKENAVSTSKVCFFVEFKSKVADMLNENS